MADSTNKRVRHLTDLIREGGGTVLEVVRRRHMKIKFVNPHGVTQLMIASISPSCHRAEQDQIRVLRKLMANTRYGIHFTDAAV